MDILSAIKTRRSAKDFLNKPISDNILFKILDAANYAPAAGGLYNWKFVIARDHKEILANASYDQEFVKDAPVVIIVCSDSKNLEREFKDKAKQYALQNTAAAIQNMILAAHSFGVSSCWAGVDKERAIRQTFNIPDNVDIHALVCLGYSKRIPKTPSKPDLSAITFFDKWNNKVKKSSPLFPILSELEAKVSTIKSRANRSVKKIINKIKTNKK